MSVAKVRKLEARPTEEPRGARAGGVGEAGRVVSVEPLVVRVDGAEREARRAVSCLVAPAPGDEVLLAVLEDRRAYVLAVLERGSAGPTELAVEGDCVVRATGEMALAARGGMSLLSGEDLSVVAGRFTLKTLATTLASETLEVVGRTLTAELDRARVAAKSVDGFFERVTQRAKRSLRITEELDQVRAARVDVGASQTLTMNAENAVVTAGSLIKIDGGQIQLG